MAGGKLSGGDLGLLFLRLALGGIFMAHGIMKLRAPGGLQGFADFLGASLALPYPYPMAVAAISAEIGGGFLVIVGLLPRLGALSLAGVMAVAIWKVHWVNGFWLVVQMPAEPEKAFAPNSAIPHGIEYNVALLAMALCVFLGGAGKLSVGPRVMAKKKPG